MEVKKQPLKRIEVPIFKCRDVAIPHHVNLLRRHKENIQRFANNGDWDRVHREQINATRLVKQLKSLLYDMDILRNQVQQSDLIQFDKLISPACQSAQSAIEEYLALNPERKIVPSRYEEAQGEEASNVEETIESRLQNQLHSAVEDLNRREECLQSWESLRSEAEDIQQLFQEFAQVVDAQRESVDIIETQVETASENVAQGASYLRSIKTGMYPVAGALLGGCVGGPVGLVAGFKMGGLAALGCGILGFTGGKLLKKRKEKEDVKLGEELDSLQRGCNMKGSISMPHIASTADTTLSQHCDGDTKKEN